MSGLYEGSMVVDFLCDRIAAGFGDEVVRAQFEEFFKAKIGQKELEDFTVKHQSKITDASRRLLSEIQAGGFAAKALKLVADLEEDVSKARNAEDARALSMLVGQMRGVLDLLFKKNNDLRQHRKESDRTLDDFAAVEELERMFPTLISITDKVALKQALRFDKTQEPITL